MSKKKIEPTPEMRSKNGENKIGILRSEKGAGEVESFEKQRVSRK
jgi:hypothetical protein